MLLLYASFLLKVDKKVDDLACTHNTVHALHHFKHTWCCFTCINIRY